VDRLDPGSTGVLTIVSLVSFVVNTESLVSFMVDTVSLVSFVVDTASATCQLFLGTVPFLFALMGFALVLLCVPITVTVPRSSRKSS